MRSRRVLVALDAAVQDYVERLGEKIVAQSAAKGSDYKYDFHVLADTQTVNAFALPGGQGFITAALVGRLQNEAQLAGVLGHEIGHVVGRHSAEHLAKAQFTQVLVMRILAESSGGSPRPEFLSTHPDPGNRSQEIETEIARLHPNGVPPELTQGDNAAFAQIRARL